MMTFAWVIVHRASPPGSPIYWTGARHRAMQWSNPGEWEQAIRFSRKEDAEAIAIFAGFYEPNPTHSIEEHGFECDKPNDPKNKTGIPSPPAFVSVAPAVAGEAARGEENRRKAMIPKTTGYYWLKLSDTSKWQVVYVIRGEDILLAGLQDRLTNATFSGDYPDALWSHQIQPPVHVMTD